MKDFDFAKLLFCGTGDVLENINAQIKNSIKLDFVNRFTLFGVIGSLSAVSPELITSIAGKAFENVKSKYAEQLDDAMLDDEDLDTVLAEAQAEIMATFEKIQALIAAHRGDYG